MDPLTALSLAANVLQFVDISARVLKESYEAVNSGIETLSSNVAAERLAADYAGLNHNHADPKRARYDDLAARCDAEADDLLKQLQKLKVSKDGGQMINFVKTIKQSVKSRAAAGSIQNSKEALHQLSGLMNNALLELLRSAAFL